MVSNIINITRVHLPAPEPPVLLPENVNLEMLIKELRQIKIISKSLNIHIILWTPKSVNQVNIAQKRWLQNTFETSKTLIKKSGTKLCNFFENLKQC